MGGFFIPCRKQRQHGRVLIYNCLASCSLRDCVGVVYGGYAKAEMKELETLREAHKASCVAYIRAFEKKQGIDFEFWIGQEVGGSASFGGEWCFTLLEIIHDIDTRQPKGLVLKWHSDCIEHAPKRIDYRSYCMGARFADLE